MESKETLKIKLPKKLEEDDILKKYLKTPEEIQKFKEHQDYKNNLEKLIQFNENINKKLDDLKNKTIDNIKYTSEELIKKLEEFNDVSKIDITTEKKGITEISKEAEKKLKEKAIEQKDKLDKELREKANKKIPFIGEFLYDWAKDLLKPVDEKADFFDKIFGKIGIKIGTMILGLLGIKKGFEEIKNMKEDKKNKGENEKKEENKQSIEKNIVKKEDIEQLKTESLVLGGFNILKGFSGVKFEKNSGERNIFNKIIEQNKTQLEIQNILNSCIDSNQNPNDSKIKKLKGLFGIDEKYSGQEIFNVLSALSNRYVNIIYSQRLNPENIKNILTGKDGKILEKYKKLFSESEINLIEEGKLDYKNLSIKNLSILITLSFSGFLIYGVSKLKKMGIDAFNYITEDSNLGKELKKELENRQSNLLPLKIATKLPSGGKEIGYSIEDLEKIEEYKNLSSLDKEKVQRFFNFKNKILSFIKNNEKIKFGVKGFDEAFNESINLQKILELYTLVDGKLDLDNLLNSESTGDSIKKATFILWIGDIIGKQSPEKEIDYNAAIINDITKNTKSDIFSKDDKLLLASLSSKIGDIYISYIERKVIQIDSAILNGLSKAIQSTGLDKNISDLLVRVMEIGGIYLFFKTFKKLNIFSKIFIGANLFLPVIAFFVKEYGTSEIKKQVGEEMYKEIQDLSSGTLDIKGTKVKVKSVEDIEKAIKNPKEYQKISEKVDRNIIDGVEFQIDYINGARIVYNNIKYKINTGPDLIDFGEGKDNDTDLINGKDVLMTSARFDKNKENIILGHKGAEYTIPTKLITEKVKEGKIQKKNNKEYILLIENTHKKQANDLPSSIENLMNNFVGYNIILEKI